MLDCTVDNDIFLIGQYIQYNTKHHHINNMLINFLFLLLPDVFILVK